MRPWQEAPTRSSAPGHPRTRPPTSHERYYRFATDSAPAAPASLPRGRRKPAEQAKRPTPIPPCSAVSHAIAGLRPNTNQSGRTVQVGFLMRFFGGLRSFRGLESRAVTAASAFSSAWTAGCGPLRSRHGCRSRHVRARSSGAHASRRDRWIAVGHRRSLRLGAGDQRAFAE